MMFTTRPRLSFAFLLFFAICPGLLATPAICHSEGVSSQGPVERVLPSGARALLWPRPGSGTVLITVAVPAGSQDEEVELGPAVRLSADR